MENNEKTLIYKDRLPIYFILAVASFQIPFAFTYLPLADEAYLFNFFTNTDIFNSLLALMRKYLVTIRADELHYLRLFSVFITTLSAIIYYKTIRNNSDFSIAFLSLLLFIVNPLTQFIYLLFLPFSIFLLIGTLTFKMLHNDIKFKTIRTIVVAIIVAGLMSMCQYINPYFIIINLLVFFIPFICYYITKYFISLSKHMVIYLIILLFALSTAYVKSAPIYRLSLPFFTYTTGDYKLLARAIKTSLRPYETIVMEDIKSATILKFYLKTNNNILSFGSRPTSSQSVLILKNELDNATDLYSTIVLVGVYSFTDNIGTSSKYYIYRANNN